MSVALRLARLHLASRRIPAACATMAGCAVVLWLALHGRWDDYGALQLPLIFEAGCAAVAAVAVSGPFGELERTTGIRLPLSRLGTGLLLTIAAVILVNAAAIGTDLAGGPAQATRNTVGLIGVGLLGAAVIGGGWAWTGPAGYLMLGLYALYTQWHGPALTTPWIWPARPSTDAGAATCAALVFLTGLTVHAISGTRDRSANHPSSSI